MEVRGQLIGVSSLLSLHKSQGLNFVVRLGSKYPYLQSHLAGPRECIFKVWLVGNKTRHSYYWVYREAQRRNLGRD